MFMRFMGLICCLLAFSACGTTEFAGGGQINSRDSDALGDLPSDETPTTAPNGPGPGGEIDDIGIPTEGEEEEGPVTPPPAPQPTPPTPTPPTPTPPTPTPPTPTPPTPTPPTPTPPTPTPPTPTPPTPTPPVPPTPPTPPTPTPPTPPTPTPPTPPVPPTPPTPPTPTPPTPPVPPVPPAPFSFINWHWQCESDPQTPPAPGANEKVVMDQTDLGTQDFEKIAGSTFVFSGHVCRPPAVKRDVVFVIDVSGSMDNRRTINWPHQRAGNDLYKDGTCGRLEAIKAIAQEAANEDIRFGLVTFGADVRATSTTFYNNLGELESSLGDSLPNVVCDGLGDTNFTKALSAANTMFSQHSRTDAEVREVYLISDGAPSPSSAHGIPQANALKQDGVRIATALLQGDSETNPAHLRDVIASKDDQGQPFHATVYDAAQLAATLADLSRNEISYVTMRYRPINGDDPTWRHIDVTPYLTADFKFRIEAFKVSAASAPDGLEAVFTYEDKYSNIFEEGGSLSWRISTP